MRKYSIHAILFNRSAAFIVAAIVACIGLLSSTLSEAQPATDSAPLFNEGFKTSTPIKLDHDVVIKSDTHMYSVDGNGHTITVYPGVLIRATRPTLELKNVTFIVNDYGDKNGFKDSRSLIVSSAKRVHISDVNIRTGKEYRDLLLPDGSGYRGRDFIRINGAESIVISKIRSYNIRALAVYNNCKNAIVRDVVSYNCETNQYAKDNCSAFSFQSVSIVNELRDKGWFVGCASGKGSNGLDVIMSGASNCTMKNVRGVNSIERVIYSTGSDIVAENLYAENTGGFKFVGKKGEGYKWSDNINVKGGKWIRTHSLDAIFNILKSNSTAHSSLVNSSNFDIFQVYYAKNVSYSDLTAIDYTDSECSSVGNIYDCDSLSFSEWKFVNVRSARPLVYVTRSDPSRKINVRLKNVHLVNFGPVNTVGEAVLAGTRDDPSEGVIVLTVENSTVDNRKVRYPARYLLGRGVSSAKVHKTTLKRAYKGDNISLNRGNTKLSKSKISK